MPLTQAEMRVAFVMQICNSLPLVVLPNITQLFLYEPTKRITKCLKVATRSSLVFLLDSRKNPTVFM